ncbi:hypothetical protein D9611_011755 [Ephemerocybe angulata]|uniref:Uncharacterized protein n=1 Tax=Ephemerocybe angulata TaxID=980116 RepID=A0A8H5FFY4_9AGAR|nr:hypothetical protein D9611_011755 [Tulosesus angulatus]
MVWRTSMRLTLVRSPSPPFAMRPTRAHLRPDHYQKARRRHLTWHDMTVCRRPPSFFAHHADLDPSSSSPTPLHVTFAGIFQDGASLTTSDATLHARHEDPYDVVCAQSSRAQHSLPPGDAI